MILPYYNCLLVAHRYSEIQIREEDEHLIKDYLEETLKNRKQVPTRILVSSLEERNSSLVLRMSNIMHMLITSLAIEVHELSNSYTQSQQTKQFYDALRQISVSPNQNGKISTLQGISSLQSYYNSYSGAKQMKEFLKKALIEELNTDRKIIRYKTSEQVQLFLKRQSDSLEGQIKIISHDNGFPSKDTDIYVLLVSHKHVLSESLIRKIEQQYPINKSANPIITWEQTLSGLEVKAHSKLKSLFSDLLLRRQATLLDEITSLRNSMLLHCSLAGVIVLGERLREQEAQKEQFLAFVMQMNAKYTKELSVYFVAFRQQLLYRRSLQKYREKVKFQKEIGRYLLGFTTATSMDKKQLVEARSNCGMLQKTIFAFLLRRRARREHLERYLSDKRQERARKNAMYEEIRNLMNEMELQKVRKHNRHKYGFSCCLHVLQLSSLSNSPCFSPLLILKLLQKLSKRREPLARINCFQNAIEFVTIEGKVLGLEQRLPQKYEIGCLSEGDKQNIDHNYESIVEQITHSNCSSNSGETSIQMFEHAKHKVYRPYQMRQISRQESEVKKQFYRAHPSQSIISSSSQQGFGVFITSGGKLFHWGKGKTHFPQCTLPQKIEITSKLVPRQAVIGTRDIFVLTANNKVYSTLQQSNIRLPKQIQQEFDHFHLVKTGNANLSICYLIAYKTDSQDKLRKRQIWNFLSSSLLFGATTHDSMLVESLGQIQEISEILEESELLTLV